MRDLHFTHGMARTKQPPRHSTSMFGHICGLYYITPLDNGRPKRHYLPQVKLDSHTNITPVCFTTKLQQTFSNSNSDAVDQVRYCFPLYDGVAVGGYTISIGDKTLKGVVKQKDVAKQTYQAAVDRGETAGLLESLPAGIFGVTLGNLPAKTDVVVEITYCGELKHDAGIDGLRYTLPTSIAPRYGSYPGDVVNDNVINSGGISITVDLDMGKSAIRKARSPSHPTTVSMGATSAGDDGNFNPSKASATLTLGSTELADDFVLQLLINDISRPQAIVESHPNLPTRAIMATLVPKFTLEPHHPEIVFIADQSGSMSGSKNDALVAALKVFLKSLPIGVRFNICAFGSSFKFLWDKSEAYNEDNVKKALRFVSSFQAAYGGTEILDPIKEAFTRRLKDMPLEVMLLTDGEIWQEGDVFTYINAQIHGNHANARVFGLGIGSDVSHTLVEGVARAGNGFAQFVTQNEETDQKVIRMLKGALYPHTKDWSIEVHYGSTPDTTSARESEDDDFEIIEKVNDCLVIDDSSSGSTTEGMTAKPVSLFDTSADLDKPAQDLHTDRYAHLPIIETPKLLQAPSTIPPLFPFNRTTVYLLLGPDTPHRNVKGITLRGTAPQGPLELTIDVSASAVPGKSVHQLAAKKVIQDLEEDRGWLQAAKASDGVLVKTKYESRFDEIVEREAVRLGEMFQVAGKWTSFVAVKEHNGKVSGKKGADVMEPDTLPSKVGTAGIAPRKQLASMAARQLVGQCAPALIGPAPVDPAVLAQYHAEMQEAAHMPLPDEEDVDLCAGPVLTSTPQTPSSGGLPPRAGIGMGGRFRHRRVVEDYAAQQQAALASARQASSPAMAYGYGAMNTRSSARLAAQAPPPPPPSGAFALPSTQRGYSSAQPARHAAMAPPAPPSSAPFGPASDQPLVQATYASGHEVAPRYRRDRDVLSAMRKKKRRVQPLADEDMEVEGTEMDVEAEQDMGFGSFDDNDAPATGPPKDVLHAIIDLQTFAGAWLWRQELFALLGTQPVFDAKEFGKEDVMATALTIAFLQTKMAGRRDVWEMVVEKARAWLGGQVGDGRVEGLVKTAEGLL